MRIVILICQPEFTVIRDVDGSIHQLWHYVMPPGLLQFTATELSDGIVRKGQAVQNAAAHLVTRAGMMNHITPVLCQVHRLPVWIPDLQNHVPDAPVVIR